ncbi:MAG: type I-C CRISPR-associated protein Cas8c/Csd1 [Clostridiaceae bacterium]|jgi:CRISPR-associated protein Csd1|nr:type I-C CRISPR-associated protein Cas8c/Csd1 [Clostridiaceae bacterium]
MNWLGSLVSTYDACAEIFSTDAAIRADLKKMSRPLLPLFHTARATHLEISLTSDGELLGNGMIFSEKMTIIPCTENSATRTNSGSEEEEKEQVKKRKKKTSDDGNDTKPHPLCDSLGYIAKDLPDFYPGTVKKIKQKQKDYFEQLKAWCSSEYAVDEVNAVLKYLEKGQLIGDLIKIGLLSVDANGKIPIKISTKNHALKTSTDILKIFVRFRVVSEQSERGELQFCGHVYQSWVNYYYSSISTKRAPTLCYATGEIIPAAECHPRDIIKPGNGAKLISFDDNDNFTFRGMFDKAEQACSIGMVTTQKAHNALKWLIDREGFAVGDQVFVAWSNFAAANNIHVTQFEYEIEEEKKAEKINSDKQFPQTINGTDQQGEEDFIEDDDNANGSDPDTRQETVRNIAKYFGGQKIEFPAGEKICMMSLFAVDKGRMSVGYFRQWDESTYFDNLNKWYSDCRYTFARSTVQKQLAIRTTVLKVRTPFPSEIIKAAYGELGDDNKLKAKTYARLVPCMVEGACLPYDLYENAFKRSCRREIFKDISLTWSKKELKWMPTKTRWLPGQLGWFRDQSEWSNKKLSLPGQLTWLHNIEITCALFIKYKNDEKRRKNNNGIKEDIPMYLDENLNSRDYLYGRLLAVAHYAEETVLKKQEESRVTTAERNFSRFAINPFGTWKTIEELLQQNYLPKMKPASRWFIDQTLDKIFVLFDRDEFMDKNTPLTGEFLLGFHQQREELYQKRETPKKDDDENDTESFEDESALADDAEE